MTRSDGWRLAALPLFVIALFALALSGCGGAALRQASSSGSLQISPGTVGFGSVAVGNTATSNVSVVNQSASPVTISSLDVTGNSFALNGQVSLPITLAAGGSYTLGVNFNPAASGALTGQLMVQSDATADTAAVVSLSGTGVATVPTAPQISGLSCDYAIAGPGMNSCSVTLASAAPAGGVTVNLASSNVAVSVPTSIQVAAGATSASFTATISAVSGPMAAVLTASLGDTTVNFDLEVETANPALNVSTLNMAFGNVAVNTPVSQTLTLTATGTATVSISSASLTGTGFSISGATFPLTLAANQSTSLIVQFDPSVAGPLAGQITLASDSSTGSTTTIGLSGTGVPVLTSLSCATSSNTGAGTDTCTVTLNAAAPSGGVSISLSSNNANVSVPSSVTVAPGASSASFAAIATAVSTAQTVTLSASVGTISKTFALQLGPAGSAIGIDSTSVAFGEVWLNSPATQTITLTSTGALPLVVTSATVSGRGFSVSGATLPLTLNPNQTVTLDVVFDPTTGGAATGQLVILSNSQASPTETVNLSGTGQTEAYSVNLTWNAPSNSADPVASYRIYRSLGGSSSYELLGSVGSSVLAYSDTNNIQDGQTYDYIVESVDASGNASSPSNTFAVTIPN